MRDEFRNSELTRRSFLRGVLAGSALLLSSCQSARTPAPTSGSSTGRARSGPTPAPAANPKLPRPDLPWTDHNVPPTYFKFPPAYQATSGVPGAGGPLTEVTWFSNQFSTPVAPLDSNACWQELNKRLGVTITPIWGPADAASFEQKFATLVAGRRPAARGAAVGSDGHARPGAGAPAGRVQMGIDDPTVGLYSPTALKRLPTLVKNIRDD